MQVSADLSATRVQDCFKHIDIDTWFNLGAITNLVFLVCKEQDNVSTRAIFIIVINISPQIDGHIVDALTSHFISLRHVVIIAAKQSIELSEDYKSLAVALKYLDS